MSKKCCGIIYNDNEKFCTMCGKSLKDLPELEAQADKQEKKGTEKSPEVLDMAEVDRIAASVLADKANETSKPVEETKEEEALEKEQPSEEDDTSEDKLAEVTEDKEEKTTEQAKKQVKDEAEDENDEEDDEDDGTASAGLKFFGTLIILLMLASIAAVGLGVYFIMLNPFYKNHDINNPVVYEQMATDTDVTNIVSRPALTPVSIEPATETDADLEETATESDATETDATDTDVSEDME